MQNIGELKQNSFIGDDHFLIGKTLFRLFFDIINGLQGLLLFLVLVVFRGRVKRELAGKKLCFCLHAPEHWRDNIDIEHQRLDDNDDEGTLAFGHHTTTSTAIH